MTFHIKIMVAHQHDQSIFTWGKLPPLLLCMRMSHLTHKKGERIKKRKSCQPFLSANKEESAVGQITDVLPHKNDHYCAKILSDFLACFHSELCHKRFWQACPSIRQTHTMRDSVRAQAVPTWWPFASASQRRCSAEQRAEFERKGVNRTTSVHLGTDSLRFWNSAEARCSCVKSSQGVFGIEMCQRSFPAHQTIRWPLLTYGRGL